MTNLHLNLGCGSRQIAGAVNYDIIGFSGVDVVHNLEETPWPALQAGPYVPAVPFDGLVWMWPESSVDRVTFRFSLEHMCPSPRSFQRLIQELYRVCKRGAIVEIESINPRHDDYFADPTITRPITPQLWDSLEDGEPLAKSWGVGFRIMDVEDTIEPGRSFSEEEDRLYNNTIRSSKVTLEVVKK